MRIRTGLLIASALILAGCQNGGAGRNRVPPGATGFTADGEDQPAYVTNGDDQYKDLELREPQPPSNVPAEVSLKRRVARFELSRFDLGEPKPKRFGRARWEITVDFRKGRSVKFRGTFKANGDALDLVANVTQRRYSISGGLNDLGAPAQKTKMHLRLVDNKKKESIVISYNAYRANIDVRADETKTVTAGSAFECQLRTLRESYAWVNNWSVLGGPVFFMNDLVRHESAEAAAGGCLPTTLTMRGESLATHVDVKDASGKVVGEKLLEIPVDSKLSDDVRLIGNPSEGNRRMFVVPLDDQGTKSDTIMTLVAQDPDSTTLSPEDIPDLPPSLQDEELDVDGDAKPPAPAVPSTEVAQTPIPSAAPAVPQTPIPSNQPEPKKDAAKSPAPPKTKLIPAPKSTAAPRPAAPQQTPIPPAAPAAAAKPSRAPIFNSGTSFVDYSLDQPRSKKQARDYLMNRNLPGVSHFINFYKARGRAKLQAYFNMAYPFVGIMRAISRAMDVIGWQDLTVVESEYFYGGQYRIRDDGDGGKAWGMFQLHQKAATEGGVRVTWNQTTDERNYFAPAACGAARYVSKHVDMFPLDATMTILAYNRGRGGAAAAVYCAYHPEAASSRQACAQRISKTFSNSDYGRFQRLYGGYRYTYREMASFEVLPEEMVNYVNNKLAVFIISSDPGHYGFSLDKAQRDLPNRTVLPPGGISDAQCKQIVMPAIRGA